MSVSVVRIIGTNDYTQTGTQQSYSLDGGLTTGITYEGPLEKLDTLFTQLTSAVQSGAASSVSKGRSDGKGTVTVSYVDSDGSGGGQRTEADDEWEILGQDLTKDLRQYDGSVGGSQAFNGDNDQDTLEAAKLYHASAKQKGIYPTAEPAITYYKLLQLGQTEYVRSAAILRRSRVVSGGSALIASWDSVDRAVSFESIGLLGVGQSALIGAITSWPEYKLGGLQWLKRAPTITKAGKGSYRITQEWWFAREWSSNMYGGDASV